MDGGLIKRARLRTLVALVTAAAALAVGMVQRADAEPADPNPPVTCTAPDECIDLAIGQP